MVKKRKVNKNASTGSRSVSAANRIAKTNKETFVKRQPLSSSKQENAKEGFGVIKGVLIVLAVLIVGATILAKYTGANKIDQGHGVQDDACTGNEDCASGHVCYQYSSNPFSCKERCKNDDSCGPDHTCKAVVRFGKKRVKPMKVCVANREL